MPTLANSLSAYQRDYSDTETLYIYGSASRRQHSLEALTEQGGSRNIIANIDTAAAHFAVALDLRTKIVSVLRQHPEPSIIQFQPFTQI